MSKDGRAEHEEGAWAFSLIGFLYQPWDSDFQSSFFNVVVQLLSCVRVFVNPWTAACQASLSFTICWSLLKLMSIESMMPSNHLILCGPLPLLHSASPASGSFPMSWLFTSSGQSIGVSASASVLPMNIQGWFPLGLTGLVSLLSKTLKTPGLPWWSSG